MDGYYEFPPHIEPKARDLIKSFLCADRSLRLGCSKVRYFVNKLTTIFRVELTMSNLINGLEVLIGVKYLRKKFLLPGFLKLEIRLIPNILIDIQNLPKLPVCQLKNNRNISLIFDHT
jgi:hypothetical protein